MQSRIKRNLSYATVCKQKRQASFTTIYYYSVDGISRSETEVFLKRPGENWQLGGTKATASEWNGYWRECHLSYAYIEQVDNGEVWDGRWNTITVHDCVYET